MTFSTGWKIVGVYSDSIVKEADGLVCNLAYAVIPYIKLSMRMIYLSWHPNCLICGAVNSKFVLLSIVFCAIIGKGWERLGKIRKD
jgi:hypothetical protein